MLVYRGLSRVKPRITRGLLLCPLSSKTFTVARNGLPLRFLHQVRAGDSIIIEVSTTDTEPQRKHLVIQESEHSILGMVPGEEREVTLGNKDEESCPVTVKLVSIDRAEKKDSDWSYGPSIGWHDPSLPQQIVMSGGSAASTEQGEFGTMYSDARGGIPKPKE